MKRRVQRRVQGWLPRGKNKETYIELESLGEGLSEISEFEGEPLTEELLSRAENMPGEPIDILRKGYHLQDKLNPSSKDDAIRSIEYAQRLAFGDTLAVYASNRIQPRIDARKQTIRQKIRKHDASAVGGSRPALQLLVDLELAQQKIVGLKEKILDLQNQMSLSTTDPALRRLLEKELQAAQALLQSNYTNYNNLKQQAETALADPDKKHWAEQKLLELKGDVREQAHLELLLHETTFLSDRFETAKQKLTDAKAQMKPTGSAWEQTFNTVKPYVNYILKSETELRIEISTLKNNLFLPILQKRLALGHLGDQNYSSDDPRLEPYYTLPKIELSDFTFEKHIKINDADPVNTLIKNINELNETLKALRKLVHDDDEFRGTFALDETQNRYESLMRLLTQQIAETKKQYNKVGEKTWSRYRDCEAVGQLLNLVDENVRQYNEKNDYYFEKDLLENFEVKYDSDTAKRYDDMHITEAWTDEKGSIPSWMTKRNPMMQQSGNNDLWFKRHRAKQDYAKNMTVGDIDRALRQFTTDPKNIASFAAEGADIKKVKLVFWHDMPLWQKLILGVPLKGQGFSVIGFPTKGLRSEWLNAKKAYCETHKPPAEPLPEATPEEHSAANVSVTL